MMRLSHAFWMMCCTTTVPEVPPAARAALGLTKPRLQTRTTRWEPPLWRFSPCPAKRVDQRHRTRHCSSADTGGVIQL
ncbi:MAG: hypothetical protein ACLRQ4_14925 [Neglectibacter timonensis]